MKKFKKQKSDKGFKKSLVAFLLFLAWIFDETGLNDGFQLESPTSVW